MSKRTMVVISDNVLPRCGHRGVFPLTITDDRGQFAAIVECLRCKATWVWGER